MPSNRGLLLGRTYISNVIKCKSICYALNSKAESLMTLFFFKIRCKYKNQSKGFPDGSNGQESASKVGDLASIPGSGRSFGEGDGNPLQYYCLEDSMDRGT